MDNTRLNEIADSLFKFIIIARNKIINEDEFIKNFPKPPIELQKYIDKYPMPPSHMKVIIYLSMVKSVPVSKISSTLNISKSNTTPIIDKLIEYDLVHRYTDSNDRRIIRVELTNTALEIFETFKVFARSRLVEKICNLPDDDLLEVQSCMCKLTDIFSKLK